MMSGRVIAAPDGNGTAPGGAANSSSGDRPLRFVHLTTFYPPYSFGGDAIYVSRLAHALADGGHQVDIVHCLDSYHALHPAEPEAVANNHPNVKVHGLRSGHGFVSPLLSQQTGRSWRKK